MKKIISVLLLALTLTLFSSCIIITDPDDLVTNYYDITCYNDTQYKITDWCVVRNGKKTFAKDVNEVCSIRSGYSSKLSHLPEGDYILYVAFVNSPDYDEGDYIESKRFKLNRNINVHIDDTYVPDL